MTSAAKRQINDHEKNLLAYARAKDNGDFQDNTWVLIYDGKVLSKNNTHKLDALLPFAEIYPITTYCLIKVGHEDEMT
jgi:hypothetical protein